MMAETETCVDVWFDGAVDLKCRSFGQGNIFVCYDNFKRRNLAMQIAALIQCKINTTH